jgi:hypothetical protein
MTQNHIVHIKRHCGWYTAEATGGTFAEAAIAAVVATCKKFRLDLDTIPHAVAFKDDPEYPYVAFRETASRPIFGGITRPGDLWFSETVRPGRADDCPSCGGTGVNFYNPFNQCWSCGDMKQRGKGTGKHKLAQAA